jgi:predicted LPLAT superfamily acyltransferase
MAVKKTQDWHGVTGGKKLGQKALLFLFHLTNVTVGYFFLALVVPFYMLFARKSYLAIYSYFRKHFHCNPVKAFFKTYQNHFVFGQCMLDRFAIYAGRKNFFRLKTTGNDEFYRLLDFEKGFILVSSHVGNFELCGYMLKQDKKKIYAISFSGETKEITENRMKFFGVNNVSLIPVLDDMSHLFKMNEALAAGDIVTMPCDRNLGSAKSVACDFLNGKAEFPVGAFALATHFDVPVISVFVMKESVANYHAFVKPIALQEEAPVSKKEKAELLTREFVKELEIIVKKYPTQWFNFFEFWKS